MFLIATSVYAIDTDFESETERDIENLFRKTEKNEDEIDTINVTIAKTQNHDHEDVDVRLRYLESEVQKAKAALGIIQWIVGIGVILIPIIGVKVFIRKE